MNMIIDLTRIYRMCSEVYDVLSELPGGIASPREHRARLGHGDGIVRACGDVADEVVLERRDGRRKFRLFPGVVAQLPVGVPSLGVQDSSVRQEHGVLGSDDGIRIFMQPCRHYQTS